MTLRRNRQRADYRSLNSDFCGRFWISQLLISCIRVHSSQCPEPLPLAVLAEVVHPRHRAARVLRLLHRREIVETTMSSIWTTISFSRHCSRASCLIQNDVERECKEMTMTRHLRRRHRRRRPHRLRLRRRRRLHHRRQLHPL